MDLKRIKELVENIDDVLDDVCEEIEANGLSSVFDDMDELKTLLQDS